MKHKKIQILAAILLILAVPLVLAYPVTMQLIGNMDFSTAVYHCADSTCAELESLYDSDSGNPVSYTINNEGAGTQYFAEYDYVSDRCYLSHAYISWFDESTGNGPWSYDIEFGKGQDCEAGIIDLDYDNDITDGEIQEIKAEVHSPYALNQDGPQTVPEELEHYYSTNVQVHLRIEKEGTLVHEETKNSDIMWSATEEFEFTFEPTENGVYDFVIRTSVDDCMCASDIEQEESGSFEVGYTPEPPQDTIPPSIEIINPEAITYETTNILVQINAYDENLEDVWFFVDSASQHDYTGPLYLIFSEGTHEIVAWAEDTAGNTNSDSVIFNIDLPNEPANILPVADFEYSPEEPLVDEEVTFDASASHDSDGTITSYFWDFGNGNTAYGKIATYQYGTEGTYEVLLKVTDDDSGISQITKSITVSKETDDEDEDNGEKDETCKSKRNEIEISDIDKKDATCGGITKITFRLKNLGNSREDILVKAANKELDIEESRIITLESKEEELVNFYLNIPLGAKGKLYHIMISAESDGKIIEETYPLQVKCEPQESVIVFESGETQESTQNSASTINTETSAGITGQVVAAGNGLGNARLSVALLGILVLIVLVAVVITNKR